MVPFAEAPGLFGEVEEKDGISHCYVQRQPATAVELDGMLRAVWHSEMACIRYAGTDLTLLARFDEYGEADLCDTPHHATGPVFRNHVRFASATERFGPRSASGLAELFKTSFASSNRQTLPLKFSDEWDNGVIHKLSVTWFEDHRHPIEFELVDPETSLWLVHHSPQEKTGSKAVSWLLHDWLMNEPRFKDSLWYSSEEWEAGAVGKSSPW